MSSTAREANELEPSPENPTMEVNIRNTGNPPPGKLKQSQEQNVTLDEQFFNAVIDGNVKKVQTCVAGGVNVAAANINGLTALHIASEQGHLKIVQYLVHDCHVDAATINDKGITALHCAIFSGHLDIVLFLLKQSEFAGIKSTKVVEIVEENKKITTGLKLPSAPILSAKRKAEFDLVTFKAYSTLSDGYAEQPSRPSTLSAVYQQSSQQYLKGHSDGMEGFMVTLKQLVDKIDQLDKNVKELLSRAVTAERLLRNITGNLERVLGALAHMASLSVRKCPTLVWLAPANVAAGNSSEAWRQWLKNFTHETFDLYFVCQSSFEVVATGVKISLTREWLKTIAPVIYLTIFVAKTAATVYSIPLPVQVPNFLGRELFEKSLAVGFEEATSNAMEAFKAMYASNSDMTTPQSTHLESLTGKGYDKIAELATEQESLWKEKMEAVCDFRGRLLWVKKEYAGDYSRAPPLEA